MCHICVSYMCVIYGCVIFVSLICVSYIHMCDIVSHLSVTCMCVSIPCMCECVFMCVHMYLPRCVTGSQRTTWKRLLSFSIVWILDIISLGSSGLAEAFFPWSHQPLVCLLFSLSDSMYWTSLYFVILFKMDVCTWNYHNLIFLHLIPKMPMHCLLAIFFTVVQDMWFWKKYF